MAVGTTIGLYVGIGIGTNMIHWPSSYDLMQFMFTYMFTIVAVVSLVAFFAGVKSKALMNTMPILSAFGFSMFWAITFGPESSSGEIPGSNFWIILLFIGLVPGLTHLPGIFTHSGKDVDIPSKHEVT